MCRVRRDQSALIRSPPNSPSTKSSFILVDKLNSLATRTHRISCKRIAGKGHRTETNQRETQVLVRGEQRTCPTYPRLRRYTVLETVYDFACRGCKITSGGKSHSKRRFNYKKKRNLFTVNTVGLNAEESIYVKFCAVHIEQRLGLY